MLENIDLQTVISITKDAGSEIMKVYQQGFSVKYKSDKSPLTEADIKSNEIICNALIRYYLSISIFSEENKLKLEIQNRNSTTRC